MRYVDEILELQDEIAMAHSFCCSYIWLYYWSNMAINMQSLT